MGIEKRTRGNIALIKDAQGNAFVINIMQIGANRSFIREVMGSLYYVMKVREPGFRDCNQGIGRRSYSCLCKPDQVATERRVLDNCLDLGGVLGLEMRPANLQVRLEICRRLVDWKTPSTHNVPMREQK
jgi:hypothetical protein